MNIDELLHEAKFVANANWDKDVKLAYLRILEQLVDKDKLDISNKFIKQLKDLHKKD